MTMAPTPSTPPPNRGRLRTKSKTSQHQTPAPTFLFLLLLTASFDITNAFLNTRFHRTSSLLPPRSSSSSVATTIVRTTTTTTSRTIPSSLLVLHSSPQNKNQNDESDDDDEEEASWDADVTYPDLSTPSSPDPDSDWDTPPPSFPSSSDLEGKLGIDIGSQLNPLTPQEAAELKAEAAEMLNDVVAERMDEIDKMKETLKEEFEQRKQRSMAESQRKAERTAEELMSKIDSMSETFLSETRSSREGTKLASRADRSMEGKGMEIGSWGNVGGGAVRVEGEGEGGGVLLGSVDEAVRESKEIETFEEGEGVVKKKRDEGKVLIVADVGQDQTAQKLLSTFTNQLTTALSPTKIQIETVKPSSTIPLGGNDAQTAILFLTSLTDRASINSILDRLLKRVALPGGGIGSPPSHIVAISTLGTARTDKFPYSMQNLMGGKLDKRRDMEEAVISTIQRRMPGVQPPMDYTIVKFGDLVDDVKVKSSEVSVRPGDVLDGEIGINAASNVLLQSLAYQPYARNATLSATGAISAGEEIANELWDDMFLRLNGPELLRIENLSSGKDIDSTWYNLVEYVNEWAITTFEGEKKTGLTTPVRIAPSDMGPNPQREGVELRSGVKIVFLPTQTGSAYKSREEERMLERERMNPSSSTKKSSSSTPPPPKISPKKAKLEGGIEVLIEKTTKGELRVRARRCDMNDDTVVKEMSEVTILKRLREGIDVWSSKK